MCQVSLSQVQSSVQLYLPYEETALADECYLEELDTGEDMFRLSDVQL